MSLPKYPHYKPSGVEWLGDVPAHWNVKRLSSMCGFKAGKAHEPYVDDDGEYTCVTARFISTQGESIKKCTQNLSPANVNDILMVMSDLPNGRALARAYFVHDNNRLAVNQRVCAISVLEGDPVYYYFQLDRNPQLLSHDDGVEQTHLSNGVFRRLFLLVPTIAEQDAIGNFLAIETAKIDALIAEQEKLIALLAEKRQATISHAVTRGLDPAAPMKDSGVAWLGEVPAHWGVCSLRRVIAAIEQGWSPECYAREAEAGEWGVLKAGCLNGGIFRATENKALPPELTPDTTYEVRVGDVLMSRASGSPELVGSTALVKETRPRLMLSDKIFRLRLQDVMTSRYFVTAMNSRALRTQIENALSGGNGMANNLPQSNLLAFSLPVPTMVEQEEISDFVETETARLDALCAEAERAIALLKERRAALIAAAVTGQIDVRGWRVN